MRTLAGLFLFTLVFIPVFAFADSIASENELQLINHWRHQYKLPLLKEDILTCTVAQFRLGEIQTDFSHKGFYESGLKNYSENLAKGFNSTNSVFKAWLASPAHRMNFFSHDRYGCVVEENGYWVFISRK